MSEVATGYVTLLPSARGFAAATSKQISGDLGKVGASAGTEASKGIKSSLLGGIGKLAGPVAAGFAALGIGKFVASSIQAEAGFSVAIRQIGVASGASGQQVEVLRKLAIKMGADTVYSAQDAADAMLELAKGGIAPAVIEGGALKAVMSLAAAGQLGLADAADITSAAMHTFNISAAHASDIADALAGGANASSADVSSLAQALSQVGSSSKLSGLNLNQTVGVLSALADKGIQGSDAGTSLKTMLQRLVPATKQASGEMKKLGLSFVDAKGNFLPIDKIAQQLKTHLDGLSESQRTNALNIIFGSDAIRSSAALYELGAKGVDKYVKATEQVGSAQKLANASMTGTNGALQNLAGSFDTAKLAVGTFLAPATITVANGLTKVLNKLVSSLSKIKAPNFGVIEKDFKAFYGALTGQSKSASKEINDPLGAILTKSAQTQQTLQSQLLNPKSGSTSTKKQLDESSSLVGILTTNTLKAVAAQKQLLNPKQPTGGSPLVGILTTAASAQQKAQSALLNPAAGQKKATAAKPDTSTLDSLVKDGNAVRKFLLTLEPVLIGVENYAKAFKGEITSLAGPILSFIKPLIPVVTGFATQVANQLGPSLTNIGKIITTQFVPAIQRILPILEPVAKFLLTFLAGTLIGALKGALNVIQGVLLLISGIIDVFVGIVTLNWKTLWTGVKDVVSGALHLILGVVQLVFYLGILKTFREGFVAIRGIFEAGDAAIEALWKGGLDRITGLPKLAWSAIKAVFRDGISESASLVRAGARNYASFMRAGIEEMGRAVVSGVGKVVSTARGLPGKIVGALGDLGGLLYSAGQKLITGLASGITSKIGAVTGAVSGLASKIKGFFPGSPVKEGPLTSWNDGATGKKLVQLLADGIRKATPAAVKEIDSLATKLGNKLQSAQASLAAKLNTKNQFAQQISQAASGVDLTSIAIPTATNLEALLGTQLKSVKSFSGNLKKLISEGLNKTTVEQLANAGADTAGAAAAALVKGGKGAVKQVNSLQGQLNKASTGLGNAVSNDLYAAGVNAAKGLVAGLESQAAKLQKIANGLGKKIAAEVKKALGIHSPSTVMRYIGKVQTAGALALGLKEGTPKIADQAAAMAAAAIPNQRQLSMPAPHYSTGIGAASAAGGPKYQFGDVYAFTPDSLVKQLDERERRADALSFTG